MEEVPASQWLQLGAVPKEWGGMGGDGEGGQVQTKKCSSDAVIMAVAVNERHRAASTVRQADGSPGRIMCRSRWIAPRRQLRVRRYARAACSGKPQLRTCTLGMPDGRGAGWRRSEGARQSLPLTTAGTGIAGGWYRLSGRNRPAELAAINIGRRWGWQGGADK